MKVLAGIVLLLCGSAHAATVLQSHDFEDGQLPSSLTRWYTTNNGVVEVVGPVHGHTDSNSLRVTNQTSMSFRETDYSSLLYEFDVSNTGFLVFRSYFLPGTVDIRLTGGTVAVRANGVVTEVGTFYNRDINFKLRTDLPNETWQLWINNQALFSGVLSDSDIRRGDFVIQSQYGNHYIDNLTVSAVPIPPAMLLFVSGLAALGWMRRKPAATNFSI